MIECNPLGGLMVIAGLASGFIVGGLASQFTNSDALPYALAGLVALPIPTVWDLAYRRQHHPERRWWRYLIPDAGGSFMFLPVWVMFGGVPVVGIIVWQIGLALGLTE